MADPTKYQREYSFTDFQANNPSQPLPGPQVDNELENIEQSLNGTIDAINDVRRADGALVNEIVTFDSLHPTVREQTGEGATAARDAAIQASQDSADSAAASASSAGAAAGSAGTAATSAGQAMTYRNAALNARDDTIVLKNGADAARDFAAQWASAPGGVDVDDGVNPPDKSAYHWAMVAEGAAAGALPDGSVTEPKLSIDVAAKLNGALQASVAGTAGLAVLAAETPVAVNAAILKYSTDAIASGASGPSAQSAGAVFETLGKTAAGDGGGGKWIVEAADPGSALKLNLNGSGKFARSLERVLRPEQFGAKFDGSLDQQQAFMDMAAELRWRGGGRVEFPDCKTFHVFDTLITNGSKLIDLGTGAKNVVLNFNGSKFLSDYDYGSTLRQHFLVGADDVVGIQVNGLVAEQTNYKIPNVNSGLIGVYIGGASHDIKADVHLIGGSQALTVGSRNYNAGTLDALDRASWIEATVRAEHCAYGYTGAMNGNHADLQIFALNVHRAYFPQNVYDHRASVELIPGLAASNNKCLLKVYTDHIKGRDFNSLSKIKLHVKARDDDPTVAAHWGALGGMNAVAIAAQQNTTSSYPANFEDIEISFDIESNGSWGPILQTSKHKFDGGVDTTYRNYLFNGISISGSVVMNVAVPQLADIFEDVTAGYNWVGEEIIDIKVSDLAVTGAGATGTFYIGGDVIKGNLTLENIYALSATLALASPSQGVLDASKQVRFSNFKSINVGYERKPNGGLEQYGVVGVTVGTPLTVNFPLAFRGPPSTIVLTIQGAPGADNTATVGTVGASSFQIKCGGTAGAVSVYWKASGVSV